MINFTIRSKKEMEKISNLIDDDYGVISISTPGSNFPNINCKNIIFVQFDDVSYDSPNVFIIGHQPIENECIYLSEENSIKILEFFDKMIGMNVKDFYVHCDMGLSRSPGTAIALSKIIGQDTKFFYKNYKPNPYVINTICNAYYSNTGKFKNINELLSL